MSHPTSFRLPAELLDRLDEEAAIRGISVTALVSSILDEGLKTLRFPGIIYRDGPTGRRAGVVGGPDIWEIIRAVKAQTGRGESRVKKAAEEAGLSAAQIRLAINFYSEYPEEIDERIAFDERAAGRVREMVERRERLLSA